MFDSQAQMFGGFTKMFDSPARKMFVKPPKSVWGFPPNTCDSWVYTGAGGGGRVLIVPNKIILLGSTIIF